MGANTKIEWAHHTFNPWRGCTAVSPGCAHCYADQQAKRNPRSLGVWGRGGTRVICHENYWRQLANWNTSAALVGERQRVFVASLADVFEGIHTMPPEAWDGVQTARRRLGREIDVTPSLDYLLVTKRPENILTLWPAIFGDDAPRKNVWLIASVENQETANYRIAHLMECRELAAVLGLSCEPLLEHVTLAHLWWRAVGTEEDIENFRDYTTLGIDWVIVGGESGPKARPCYMEWIDSILAQCQDARVACFIKQLGENPRDVDDEFGDVSIKNPLSDDRKNGDWTNWPADLQVRQFPELRNG